MKKNVFFIFLTVILCFTSTAKAQENDNEQSQITYEGFDMKSYSKYKGAEAAVIFDVGKSHFEESEKGFRVVYERKTRIKILSNAGIRWGEIEIPYNQSVNANEEITDLQGVTYNADETGYITKTVLNEKNVFSEKVNNDWRIKKFAMPDVKVGSVIEYTYKIYSDYIFNLREWEFQWKIPVMYSKYTASIIPFYEYVWLFQGAKKFDKKNTFVDEFEHNFSSVKYRCQISEFIMKDVPAFDDEEFITSKNDYVIKIVFQLTKIYQTNGTSSNVISTWQEMNKDLLETKEFGDYILKSEKLGLKNPEIQRMKSTVNEEEKFNHVLDYVKNNFKWDGENDKYASKTPTDFEKQKTGNAADINLYTIGLLKSVGINVKPVVISTRLHGKIKYEYPYLNSFNYVIILANLNNNNVVSDATEIMCLNNRIPERCVNNKGLVVEKNKAEWIGLEVSSVSDNNTNINMTFDEKNTITGEINKLSTEYEALKYKNKFDYDKEKVKNYFKSQTYEINDSTIKFEQLNTTNKTYAFNFEIKSNPEIVNNKMYINPFLGLNITQNPFKNTERKYPIDMVCPRRTMFTSNIKIPKGWQIDYLPENMKSDDDFFSIEYKITKSDDVINVSFSHFFKKSVYPENFYLLLKSYLNDIVNKGNDKIVLSKK